MKKRAINQFDEFEMGFTLLETLIALAIFSLTSLALFQSIGTMLSVSDKAAETSESIAENTITREIFKQIVGGLTPGWKHQPETQFKGLPLKLSGLSSSIPSKDAQSLSAFELAISYNRQSANNTLYLSVDGRTISLNRLDSENIGFEYLGEDQVWYEVWPPDDIPSPGFFDDVDYMQMPNLPLAVRINGDLKTGNGPSSVPGWTAFVYNSPDLPYREDLTIAR